MNNKELDCEFDQEFVDDTGNFLTDETIPQELINEMKMLGQSRPQGISWDRWNRIQNQRIEHDHMIMMAASGRPQAEIARELGYTDSHVSKVLNTPAIKDAVQAEMNQIYGQDYKKVLKDRAMKAVRAMDDVLENGKNSEKLQAAQYILDHTVGKAQQNIEVKTTLLADVMIKVEQLTANQLRDVNGSSPLLTHKPSKFDTIIEQIVPEGVVIGVRTDGKTQQSK